ncbi:predicted protein [Histoplasma capsulatum G186AR]|uniref:Uncharacterized protein n=1 Tax=Ajellomyces capsulatus (strain G186AR / H82 / ATCC MYA-2454 / RMSCC 2432) TaxID=447093 RepID=C0NAJ0_AJECG|nr:uncharacterized protein HCBG_00136 [Histoplasma capsulatum G186AR]EEH10681.1 predicted protein [Histoplasma capsulatum G186AR]
MASVKMEHGTNHQVKNFKHLMALKHQRAHNLMEVEDCASLESVFVTANSELKSILDTNMSDMPCPSSFLAEPSLGTGIKLSMIQDFIPNEILGSLQRIGQEALPDIGCGVIMLWV